MKAQHLLEKNTLLTLGINWAKLALDIGAVRRHCTLQKLIKGTTDM
jgi:hypothetical protein